ncbi:MAG: DUF4012 domain-containing protein [Patescibacteria group bacterium]
MILFNKKKKRLWPYFILVFFLLLIAAGFWTYRWLINLDPIEIWNNQTVRNYIDKNIVGEEKKLVDLLPDLLGLNEPKNYLLLFLNNTELRPGGGFIGSYAVVNVNKGAVEILKVEGTEILDRNTPADWQPAAPSVLTDHLGVDKWYFRDSNWSPDFMESSKKGLEFYQGERGLSADKIDLVAGVTPTVLEKIMEIIGPVTIDGITFTAEDVTEKLEYEVEYGFVDKDLSPKERKQIMEPFAKMVSAKIKQTMLTNLNQYVDLASDLIEEKQIMFYSPQADLQKKLSELNLTGEVSPAVGDYLMWVDANLAALKTDLAIDRTLSYSFFKNEEGKLVARASMNYQHQGKFDWRTTRYRTYARVFVPEGSELISVEGAVKNDQSKLPGTVDMGTDLDRQWFGAFIAIEPGETGVLTFTYLLPESISKQIEDGLYTLFVQKQLGAVDHALTLHLNFDKTIRSASMAEEPDEWGNGSYVLKTDLRVDRSFSINLSS